MNQRVGDDTGEVWVSGIDDALVGSPDPQRAFASLPSNARDCTLARARLGRPSGPPGPCCSFPDTVTEVKSGCRSLARLLRLRAAGDMLDGLNFAAGMPILYDARVGVYRPPVLPVVLRRSRS